MKWYFVSFTHQTIELRDGALVSWVTNVPDLDTTLSSSVNVSGGVTDGDGTHHLPVVQCVYLTGMTWDPWSHQSIWGERNWLHLSIRSNMEGVGTDGREKIKQKMREEF